MKALAAFGDAVEERPHLAVQELHIRQKHPRRRRMAGDAAGRDRFHRHVGMFFPISIGRVASQTTGHGTDFLVMIMQH
ncbi:hypothetical protein [Bradyrhizobium sp. SZCCHNS3002]|uniref:hypothetical protein n=1 Tax=Bradyrhizobium sp. SZCCHNS3002 TaxID=3057310 RepID=UPI0028E40077|nr:hypothetical protein [Bradyrhizobium sp. SZCCHNS3002]